MSQYADIIVPDFSDDIDDVHILNWLKNEGETISFGEPIVELEVNKSAVELESPVDGILDGIYCWEGEEVIAGERIGVVLVGNFGEDEVDEKGEEFDFKDAEKYDI